MNGSFSMNDSVKLEKSMYHTPNYTPSSLYIVSHFAGTRKDIWGHLFKSPLIKFF